MSTPEPAAYRSVVEQLLADGSVTETQMMGMPALKAGSKMFGGRSGADLVLKLGRERVEELMSSGRGEPFDPSGRGRPMKDWTRLSAGDDWPALAREARDRAVAEQG